MEGQGEGGARKPGPSSNPWELEAVLGMALGAHDSRNSSFHEHPILQLKKMRYKGISFPEVTKYGRQFLK